MLYLLYAITVLFLAGDFVNGPILSPLLLNPHSDMVASGLPLASRSLLVTVVIACFCLGQIIAAPLWGAWVDRYGAKRCLQIGLAMLTLSYALSGLALQLHDLYAFMLSRGLCGFATSLLVVIFFILAKSPDGSVVTRKRMGNVVAASALGALLGGLLGGVLGDPRSPVSLFGYATPFYVLALVAVVLFALLTTVSVDERSARDARVLGLRPSFVLLWRSERRNRLLLFLLYYFFFTLSIYTFYMGFPISSVIRFHLGAAEIGMAMAMASVVAIISATLLNRWLLRYLSPAAMSRLALALLISAFGFFAWGAQHYTVYVSMIGVGLVDVLIWASSYQLMADLSEQDSRGKSYGLMVFTGSVASLVSALGLAHWAALQSSLLFVVCSLSALLAIVVLSMLRLYGGVKSARHHR